MKIHSILTGILAILCLAVAVFTGYRMYHLSFWGYYPCWFLFSGWMAIVLIFKSLKTPNSYSLGLLATTMVSGLILAKGFIYSSPLLFIGFIPLLWVQSKLEASDTKSKTGLQWWYAFNTFMFWNIGATWWVANAALIPAIIAFLANSLLMSIPWMGMIHMGRKFPYLKYPALIVFWISFEWIHQTWDLSWPWLTLGNGLAFIPRFVQWYDITGTFGGSLWILSINILVFLLITSLKYRWLRLGFLIPLMIVPPIISLHKYEKTVLTGKPVEIGIVQPNYEPHTEKFNIEQNIQMLKYENLSRIAITPNTSYLIWPETSFEYIQTDQFETDWRIKHMRDLIGSNPKMCIVSGLTTLKVFNEGDVLTDAARKNKRAEIPAYYEIQNSAIQLCESGEIPIYVKSKLVPGVEIFPYRNLLPFLKPIVEMLHGSVNGLGRQKERAVFEKNGLKIAPVICYESIYGDYIGDYIRRGAQAIFIMTNDGWWDDTPGCRQHLAYGILRAIEFRRSIARAANSGISCFVNARGDISNQTQYGKDAAITGNILFSDVSTFYLRHGDFIAVIALIITTIFILIMLWGFLKVHLSKNQ
jgi:apolipoprotein N-acyltransferase